MTLAQATPLPGSGRAGLIRAREEGAGAGERGLAPEEAGSRSAREVVARGRGAPVVVCAAVAGWAEEKVFTVVFVCVELGVAESGFYRWKKAGPTNETTSRAP
jgi:hypothetical protein